VSRPGVVIIDGGGANIASLRFALQRLGQAAELTTDPDRIRAAERVILPGVGAARAAMQGLAATGLDRLIPELTQPVLGICLGLQLLGAASDEDDSVCLGIFPGRARRLPGGPELSVPHMGWNRLHQRRPSPLFADIDDGAHFYFVHSYALPVDEFTTGSCDYGVEFAAVVERGNFMATQFHPERSGTAGARLLANFLAL